MNRPVFNLWALAKSLAYSEGEFLRGDGVTHWSWCADAEKLGYDCTYVPDGFELAAVRIEPCGARSNSKRVLRVFRLQRSETSGREVLRVTWDEADGQPLAEADLNVEKFERGLWEAALEQRAERTGFP